MGNAGATYVKSKAKSQRRDEPALSAQERLALKKLRREARAAGATLATGGKGGLPPSLVLGRMRRDKYRCQNEDCPDPQKDLTVDHISGHPKEIAADPGARNRKDLKRGIKLGHVNTIDAIHTVCATCHDFIHERERQIDSGKKPEPMPGAEK